MSSRNEQSRFAVNPQVDIKRSRFDRSSSVKTSFNVGDLIPFYVDEVLPGDTFSVDTSKVVRLQTLITPMMDNLYLDTYYFFVPNRLVWDHWKEFMGENTTSAWYPEVEYSVPQLLSPAGGWSVGTIADYFGIPTGVPNLSVNALPFRAYALICNDWFRDQNLSDPVNIPMTDSDSQGVNTGTFVTDLAFGGLPYTAAKYHDYFTSCLPAPQKGPEVTVPILANGLMPVYATGDHVPTPADFGTTFMQFDKIGSFSESDGAFTFIANSQTHPTPAGDVGMLGYYDAPVTGPNVASFTPSNLWANVSVNNITTINQLRLAFQTQKLFERDARGGTRYIEMIKAHFGVTNPDYRLQRPEYLGGNRVPITINQVLQQSGTTDVSPQGTPTGQSLTTDQHSDFTKSFTEHGFIIGLMVARYDHTYQQGLNRLWSRKQRLDYYFPVLANIGEQAVLNKEIYAQGSAVVDSSDRVVDNKVFGYQEAWAEYRYKPNIVTSEMRSSYAQSLDVWHLGDDYESLPALSDSWIREDKTNVDRVLAVNSTVANQLFADIYIKNFTTRPMPVYSIPGLLDHN